VIGMTKKKEKVYHKEDIDKMFLVVKCDMETLCKHYKDPAYCDYCLRNRFHVKLKDNCEMVNNPWKLALEVIEK